MEHVMADSWPAGTGRKGWLASELDLMTGRSVHVTSADTLAADGAAQRIALRHL